MAGPLESSAMSPTPSPTDPAARREPIVIASFTVVGGLLRLWSVGRLGLVHFDEGIYAMAGTWVLSPRGLAGIDPTVISYAPPGFPFLVGLSYGLFGVGDIPAILVSIVMGTLTIPIAGWLGHRTFGRGAGAAASALAAMSGPHIAFSRMALTDASFLFFWLVAIGQGQRFLERPGPWRAFALGIAVGVAQLFKYNGWLAGVVVALSAVVWTAARRDARTRHNQLRLWGWGALAAAVAAVVYLPWFAFVESHGGYAALLAHHRSYLGGPSSWPGHLWIQWGQAFALSCGQHWIALGSLSAIAGLVACVGLIGESRRITALRIIEAGGLAGWLAGFRAMSLGGVAALIVLARKREEWPSRSVIVPTAGWCLLAAMTPFYHPYARLMLPLQGLAWILMAGALTRLFQIAASQVRPEIYPRYGFGLTILLLAVYLEPGTRVSPGWNIPMTETSDSLRRACRSIASQLPKNLTTLRLHARPPVTFYLSGVVPVAPRPTPEAALAPGDPGTWVLLDSAMTGQGGLAGNLPASLLDLWEPAREFPTTLNLPTLLDVDPTAPSDGPKRRSAPLFLFRPKRPGVAR